MNVFTPNTTGTHCTTCGFSAAVHLFGSGACPAPAIYNSGHNHYQLCLHCGTPYGNHCYPNLECTPGQPATFAASGRYVAGGGGVGACPAAGGPLGAAGSISVSGLPGSIGAGGGGAGAGSISGSGRVVFRVDDPAEFVPLAERRCRKCRNQSLRRVKLPDTNEFVNLCRLCGTQEKPL